MWVFKRCRDEGLLLNDVIRVRVRQAKSAGEFERYSIDNCAVEAKFMREKEMKKDEGCEKQKLAYDDETIRTSVKQLKIDGESNCRENAVEKTYQVDEAMIGETQESGGTRRIADIEDDNGADDTSSESEDENFRRVNTNRFCFDDSSSDDSSSDDN